MRFLLYTIAVFIVMAWAPTGNASGDAASPAREVPAHTVTVCELARWGQARIGTHVRVSAEYFTDFHHGAFLSDPRCPFDRLQIGVDAIDADKSVSELDEAIALDRHYYIGRKFKVDVTGVFEWNTDRILNKELPPDRQLRIPAHGVLSLLKVWCFEKPKR